MLMKKSYAHLRFLIEKHLEMLIKLTVKHFNSILQAFLHCKWLVVLHHLLYSGKNYILDFRLGDMMYFSRTFTLLLRRKETILTKSSLLCESSLIFAPENKSFASNNEAILTYKRFINTILLLLYC